MAQPRRAHLVRVWFRDRADALTFGRAVGARLREYHAAGVQVKYDARRPVGRKPLRARDHGATDSE